MEDTIFVLICNTFFLVMIMYRDQRHFLVVASRSKKPSDADLVKLLAPTSQAIQGIQSFREKNRTSPLFNHLSAMSESIPALGWVTVAPAPGPYIKEMNDAGQFYTNRVLKDWKDKYTSKRSHVTYSRNLIISTIFPGIRITWIGSELGSRC